MQKWQDQQQADLQSADVAHGSGLTDWRERVIFGDRVGGGDLPPWLQDSYTTLRKHVMDPAYPCFFGTMAEKRGEMFYSYVEGKDIARLPATMARFAALAKLPEFEKNNIAIFFEPDIEPLSHAQYHDHFWRILQHLHDRDPGPGADHQPAPDDPKWEFAFAGVEMFVVCACPSFGARHSRNLGPGMVLLFQPRSVFVDKVTNRVIGLQAREEVRRRLKKWDAIPAHPDLGFYGDPGNLEWKQYFLPDDNTPAAGRCPFLARSQAMPREVPQEEASPRAASPTPATSPAPEAPPQQQMRELAERYAALPPDRRAAFRAALAQRDISPALLPVAMLSGRDERMPLSYEQERMWFLWKMAPTSAAYNISNAVRLEGDLNRDAVRAAIDNIVRRHEILRTTFEQGGSTASQIIHEDLPLDWQETDLSEVPEEEAQARLPMRLHALAQKPFDLERGPLLRASLVRMSSRVHVLHLVMHHIVGDAWSHALLAREFHAGYQAATVGEPVERALPPLSLQYADLAAWQREWLDAPAMQRQLDYWKTTLGDEHPVLALPGARKRADGAEGARPGGRVRRELRGDLFQRFKRVADEYEVTPFVILLAAYYALLSRYSGQADIRVGVPVAGRQRAETQLLIGCFVNTLVLRAQVRGADRFEHLLKQVRAAVLNAQAHQDLPFARLVEALQPERSLDHTPLFQVMFNHVAAAATARMEGLRATPVELEQDSAKFDLTLNAIERPDGVRLSFSYARDRFDPTVAEALADDYLRLLEQVLHGPACAVGNLRLGERQEVKREAASLSRSASPDDFRSIAARVQQAAARSPRAQAIHCEGRRVSHGELAALTDRVAARLLQLDVRAEERIGICIERSPDMIAAMLGVMKAGAAFVPLDPGYPQERLNFMLGNAGVRRVVADPPALRKFPDLVESFEAVLLGADDCAFAHDAEPTQRAAWPEIHPEQLAYVIYTSGSTGQPKGVALSHRALARHIEDFIATHDITAEDKVLHLSTINFDVALHEIFPALIQGGSIDMRGPGAWDLATVGRHLSEQGVSFARLPTAYWQQWLRELPRPEDLPRLRQITVGGEALHGGALRIWQQGALRHIAVANLYGPTETTVACMHRQTTEDDALAAIVSIGDAYPSRRVHVLDGDANPLPPMVEGELCIGGDTLARGYLGRPDLTAERFVPDPFGGFGARLYRSGDVCRARDDGAIDYLGRHDKQVKLRGLRIELGEIENLLRGAPGIGEAAVEVIGDGVAAKLVAFVTGEFHKAEVIAWLQRRLPDYMLPADFVVLDAMPLMPNGKLDRAALQGQEIPNAPRETVAPRSPEEARLLAIWQEVLGGTPDRDAFGVTDNFFEIGGNSLLALRVAALAQQRGVDGFGLPLLFRYPTIAALAEQCRHVSHPAADDGTVVPLNGLDEALDTLFVLPPSSGLVFDYRHLAQAFAGQCNVIGLQVPVERDAADWPVDFAALARHHVNGIRALQPRGPYRLLGWSLGGLLAVEIAHQLEAEGESLAFVGVVDAKSPLQRAVDRVGKNRELVRRAQPSAAEMDSFWRDLDAQDSEAAHALRARQDQGRFAENVVRAPNYLMALTSAGVDRRITADLHVWWSAETPPESRVGWDETSSGTMRVAHVPDVSHREIVKSPLLAQAIRDLLRTRRSADRSTD